MHTIHHLPLHSYCLGQIRVEGLNNSVSIEDFSILRAVLSASNTSRLKDGFDKGMAGEEHDAVLGQTSATEG